MKNVYRNNASERNYFSLLYICLVGPTSAAPFACWWREEGEASHVLHYLGPTYALFINELFLLELVY